MASKQVEKRLAGAAKQKQAIAAGPPQPPIQRSYVDTQKSIDNLIQAGLNQHEARLNNRSKLHYERKPKTLNSRTGHALLDHIVQQLPPSFSRPPSCKSRGSSAGHSREGSSDDGIGSSGRHTLSPSSVSSSTMVGGGTFAYSGAVHTRQRSAPELANPAAMERHTVSRHIHPSPSHHHPYSSTPMIKMPHATVGAAGLPGDEYALANAAAAVHPRSAFSCDFDVIDGIRSTTRGTAHPTFAYTPEAQPYIVEQQRPYWGGGEPERRSQSLDPLTVAGISGEHLAHPVQQQSMMPNQELDDGYPMPEGWTKAIDNATGDVYFIDHINKRTTWYDPRIPDHLQEEQIRLRHSCLRGDDKVAGGGYEPLHQDMSTLSGTQERVQQLQMERDYMQMRRQQLCNQGLLDQQQRSPQQYNSHSPMSPVPSMQTPHTDAYMMSPGSYVGHPSPSTIRSDQAPFGLPTGNTRNPSNDSAFDIMEVDQVPHYHHQQHIDLPIVGEYDFHLNPQEFEKYLQLNDTANRAAAAATAAAAKQYM